MTLAWTGEGQVTHLRSARKVREAERICVVKQKRNKVRSGARRRIEESWVVEKKEQRILGFFKKKKRIGGSKEEDEQKIGRREGGVKKRWRGKKNLGWEEGKWYATVNLEKQIIFHQSFFLLSFSLFISSQEALSENNHFSVFFVISALKLYKELFNFFFLCQAI